MIVLLAFLLQDAVLESSDLLDSPIKADFTIAKTAPRVEVWLLRDLPAGERQTLWSSWGDGTIGSDGRYYTSVGDHRGRDATARVYRLDKEPVLLVDVAKATSQKPGAYGHGKIHAGLHEYDGGLWFATYWGKPREIAFDDDYHGSILLRRDLKSGAVENLGAVAPKRGLPASLIDGERALLYFHSVAPSEEASELFVYDLKARKPRFSGGGDVMDGKRTFMRDATGRVWFGAKGGVLAHYDPEKNAIVASKAKLPESGGRGNDLRAAARPSKDGTLFAMTAGGRLFSFDPSKEEVRDQGPNFSEGDYTAVMALSPDGRFVYFAPGAHGSSVRTGTPIVQIECATGKRKALAFLNAPVRRALKYNLGGTYNLQMDPAGARLFITFNGAPYNDAARKAEAFGAPCVAVVNIPSTER
jgi:sugar lactone lactonase YvrE